MRGRWLAAAALSAATIAGCGIFEPLDGLSGGDAGARLDAAELPDVGGDDATDAPAMDASPTGDAMLDAREASTDAGAAETSGPAAPVTIADVGAVAAPSGHAQQGPLVWLSGAQAWWLFYESAASPTTLATLASSDFQTWSPVGTITLPGPPTDGRNIAALAGAAGGEDVLHVAVGVVVAPNDRRHLHVRAHPLTGMLQFDAYDELGTTSFASSNLDPDGPATALGSDGTVLDTSGWYQVPDSGATANEFAWLTTSPDPGGAWIPTWGAVASVETVPQYVNARAAVALPGGSFMALWEAGDAEPDPTNVHFALLSSGQWSAAGNVFAASPQDPNDWGACLLNTSVHAVRHTSSGAWEHRVWSGAAFADGGTMPKLDMPVGAGAVVLCDASSVRVFAIAPDAGNPVDETQWDGTSWSAWKEVVAPGATRSYLSGAITPDGQAALVWTEGSDGGSVIAGALVSK